MRSYLRIWAIAVKRNRKDAQARRLLIDAGVVCAVNALLAFVYVHVFGRDWGDTLDDPVFYGVAAIVALQFAGLLLQVRPPRPQLLRLEEANYPGGTSPELLAYLRQRTLVLAALIWRAFTDGSRSFHGREKTNRFLRAWKLWDTLESGEKELFSLDEGVWKIEQRASVVRWTEQLRLLRWTLGFDPEVIPLTDKPRPSPSLSWDLFKRSKYPLHFRIAAETWHMRAQRDIAAMYLSCVGVELSMRGFIKVAIPQVMDGIKERSRNLLVGDSTLAELNQKELQVFAETVRARRHYSKYLLDLLETGQPKAFAEWAQQQKAAS